MDKELIRKRFSRRLDTYHHEAVEQKKMAAQLIELVDLFVPQPMDKVLEIGSGTGFLTELLFQKELCKSLIANDIVPECSKLISFIHPNIEFIAGDAEELEFKEGSLDAVYSGAVFQWIENWPEFFAKLSTWLRPGGLLVFSSFGPDNYREIKKLTGLGLDYTSLKRTRRLLSKHYRVLESREYREEFDFSSAMELLKHIRNTGVNGLSKQLWTREKLKTFEEKYRKQFLNNEGKLTLTYHPYFIVAEKKES